MGTKKCSRCSETKNKTNFNTFTQNKILSTGELKQYTYHYSYCMDCAKEAGCKKTETGEKEIFIDKLIKFAKQKGFKHLSHARDVIGLKELKKMYYEENK